MENKLKFFGIYENSFKFRELSEQEQKKFLIESAVYVEGKSIEEYNEELINPFYIDRSQNILFLGKDFVINQVNYTLNSDFINEIYKVILENFETGNLKNINEHIKVLNITYSTIENEEERVFFLNDTKKKANQDYRNELTNKIFQDFHNQKKVDSNYKENVVKKHLIYDIKHLSDYIFGLNNHHSFLTITSLQSFLRITEILDFCDKYKLEIETEEFEKIDFTKPSIPKSIAMLKATGFFELENIKKLKSNKLHQVIAIIIGKDPNNSTDIRSIRGNCNILNPNSEENPVNFTSNSHIKDMLNLLK